MKYLENKNILITGGAGGLGWGMAVECAKAGAKVILTDINDKKGQEVLDEILKISQGHSYVHMDVKEINQFINIVDQIENEIGPVDVLINNAGVNNLRWVTDMTEEDWDNVFDTNLKGHMFLTKNVVNRMIDKNIKGSVIFISSIHQYIPSTPHYSASKAATNTLVKEMAAELAKHSIRVNGIAPGGIYVSKRVTEPVDADNEPTVLLGGKNGIPSDIGRMAVVLASEYWSRHITGQMITVAGGQYMRIFKKD